MGRKKLKIFLIFIKFATAKIDEQDSPSSLIKSGGV
jgi:hypothetical protein